MLFPSPWLLPVRPSCLQIHDIVLQVGLPLGAYNSVQYTLLEGLLATQNGCEYQLPSPCCSGGCVVLGIVLAVSAGGNNAALLVVTRLIGTAPQQTRRRVIQNTLTTHLEPQTILSHATSNFR